jgi:hypothetical protein
LCSVGAGFGGFAEVQGVDRFRVGWCLVCSTRAFLPHSGKAVVCWGSGLGWVAEVDEDGDGREGAVAGCEVAEGHYKQRI